MSDIYIPPGCSSLDEIKEQPQLRLGLQGPPGVGKTWAALLFPNPIVLNIDRGLVAHQGRKDVMEVPFYNPAFIDKIVPRSGSNCPPNRRDAILKWLGTEGQKLTSSQTLVVDSQTQLQTAFHAEYRINPVITKNGKIDDFAEWNLKIVYFGEIMDWLKSLKCNVVYICHETADRDKAGELNGMVRPLLTGQFADQLASHFTDWFRCLAYAKPNKDSIEKAKEFFKLSNDDLKEWMDSSTNDTFYVWQTQSDAVARHIKTSLVRAPKLVIANPKVFDKYKMT